MTYLINFIGYPAATVPAGLAENGLPVGMQIVGKRYADADVIAASAEFERLRPWMDTYRSCNCEPSPEQFWHSRCSAHHQSV